MNFVQRINLANNQLLTVDVTFDQMLRYLNVTGNYNLANLETTGCNSLSMVRGAVDDVDLQ